MVDKFDYKLQPKNEIPNTKQATSLNQENMQTIINILQSIITSPQSSALQQSEESSRQSLRQNVMHSSQLQKNTMHSSQLDQSSEFATSSQEQNSHLLASSSQLDASLLLMGPHSRIKRNVYGDAIASCPKLTSMYIYIYIIFIEVELLMM